MLPWDVLADAAWEARAGRQAAAGQRPGPRARGGLHLGDDGRAEGRDAHAEHRAGHHLLADRAPRLLGARRHPDVLHARAPDGLPLRVLPQLPARGDGGVPRHLERRGGGAADRDRARHVHDGRDTLPAGSGVRADGARPVVTPPVHLGGGGDPAPAREGRAGAARLRHLRGLGHDGERPRHVQWPRRPRGEGRRHRRPPAPRHGSCASSTTPSATSPRAIEGDLLVKGPAQFVGYWKRPEFTRDGHTADGWFKTGDRATLDADGYVSITGRSKDVIIRGGENIPVAEVENALFTHPKVAGVAVVAMPDPRLQERACAFVIPKRGRDGDPRRPRGAPRRAAAREA